MKRSLKTDEADLGSCPAGRELGSCDGGLWRAGSSQALSEYAFSVVVVVVAAAAAERELRILSANILIFRIRFGCILHDWSGMFNACISEQSLV